MSKPSKDTELTELEKFILERFFNPEWVKLQESPQYAYYLVKDDDEAIKISPQELVAIIERYAAEAVECREWELYKMNPTARHQVLLSRASVLQMQTNQQLKDNGGSNMLAKDRSYYNAVEYGKLHKNEGSK